VFGLEFGELFIVAFVVITVVGAPYAGPLAERVAVLLHLVPTEVDAPGDRGAPPGSEESTEERRG
jgi:hypothetical protein